MAIVYKGGYSVGMGYKQTAVKHMPDVRTFKTFEEANICAKRIASGEFNYYKGVYINNR
jgi:hypothetical protein